MIKIAQYSSKLIVLVILLEITHLKYQIVAVIMISKSTPVAELSASKTVYHLEKSLHRLLTVLKMAYSQLITLTNIPESQLVTRSPRHMVNSSP